MNIIPAASAQSSASAPDLLPAQSAVHAAVHPQDHSAYSSAENLVFDSKNQVDLETIKTLIRDNVEANVPLLKEAVSYLGEKQFHLLRPLLAIKAASCLNYQDSAHLQLACVIEYLHASSQLHQQVKAPGQNRRLALDDLEIHSNEASVLLGDYLLSRSFQILTQLGCLPLLQLIAKTTKTIARGQVMAMQFQLAVHDTQYFLDMERSRFAGLYAAAAEGVAHLAFRDDQVTKTQHHDEALYQKTAHAFSEFGMALGLSCTLKNDLNTVISHDKSRQVLRQGHIPFPCLFLSLNERQTLAEQVLQAADFSLEDHHSLLQQMEQQGALQATQTQIENCLKDASACLTPCQQFDTLPMRQLVKETWSP